MFSWFHSSPSYTATNEAVLGYEAGSPERKELEEKIKFYDSQVHDVPIVVGDEEIRNNDVRYQVRPFDHQNKLAKYYYADKGVLEKAIKVSQEAHSAWERVPLEEKSDIFLRAADLVSGKYRMDLLASTMLGQAKNIMQAEIDAACELADFYRFNVEFGLNAQKWQPISTQESNNRMILRGMEGFWAAIAPFNFTAISGHLAGAPAFMGNVVLWKSSDTAMLSSYICYKILREAGVPSGVINFVPADGPVFGNAVCGSPLLAGINFTGSAKTFHHLWQEVAKNITNYKSFPRLIGECGGKNFHFVHPTANLQSVVYGSLRSAFEYSGQKCSALSRMYVPESCWDTVREGLTEEHKNMKLGSPLEADSFLSAVIDGASFNRIKGYLEHAKSSPNVKIIAGGECDDSQGYYVQPTILQTTDPNEKLMQEEIFGPILTVYVYKDAEYKSVLKLIDQTSPYSLTGAIYADDPAVLKEASEALRFSAGNFYVNDKSTGSVVSQQPFGGARKSGTNDKAGGPHYLLKFTSPQSIKTTSVPASRWDYPYMSS
ncbi:hypothetical protein CAPTEDRAFT_218806 [Capitella teleta]|uniref:Multifunctional fusion protein n=1 Tax=Capitella teleta TaxID=283909 RepID=R7U7Q4_CAPTE|nr:hypothetical protein CAPTEDRAFT_218806 [Capitella teleta]|eukprot:ELU02181.1 hypothetical protein CAPTEDRAFT_218806 [Capitella teleta]